LINRRLKDGSVRKQVRELKDEAEAALREKGSSMNDDDELMREDEEYED